MFEWHGDRYSEASARRLRDQREFSWKKVHFPTMAILSHPEAVISLPDGHRRLHWLQETQPIKQPTKRSLQAEAEEVPQAAEAEAQLQSSLRKCRVR